MNISRNLAFGRREKNWGTKSFSGGAKMSIRGDKLTFGGGENFFGVQKLQGAQKVYKKNPKKVATFFFED